MSVLVVGSFIVDFVSRTERAPKQGETVVGLSFDMFFGGKGANQAIAAKRLGSEVTMVGCVGNDVFGDNFIDIFKNEGISIDYIKRTNVKKTGCSLVTVETSGQNRICMVPGGNLDYTKEELISLEKVIAQADVVVTQCEMKAEIVDCLAQLCRRYNKKFILNPAPARTFSKEVLSGIYAITPNETELGVIVGRDLNTVDDFKEAGKQLLKMGVKNVIVTLGEKGCMWVSEKGVNCIPAYKVKPIDTVGAGDSFTGALAAMTDQGYEIEIALKTANAVGALSVQKAGAIPSMPYKSDVEAFMRNQ